VTDPEHPRAWKFLWDSELVL